MVCWTYKFFFYALVLYQIHKCQSQWDVLTKYIENYDAESWYDAQKQCNSLYGTSLASIHNDIDNTAIRYVFSSQNAYLYDIPPCFIFC